MNRRSQQRRRRLGSGLWLGLLATLLPAARPGGAAATSVDLELISRRSIGAGDAANGFTRVADATPDGRYVLLTTRATHLAPGVRDDNGSADLVVYDRVAGSYDWITTSASRPGQAYTTTQISPSMPGKISGDGRWIAFSSASTDLAAGVTDANERSDVFLFDRVSRSATLVSHLAASATTAAGGSLFGLSGDGRYLLFTSSSPSVVAGQVEGNDGPDIFLFDRIKGQSILAPSIAGQPATTPSEVAVPLQFSRDGRFVLYLGHAQNLVAGFQDGNGPFSFDLYLFDRVARESTLITHAAGSASAGSAGEMLDTEFPGAQMTPDASHVAYAYVGADLVPGFSGSGWVDTFVWERSTGANRLASGVNGSATLGGNQRSRPQALSADGRFVLLESWASDLFPGLVTAPRGSGLFRRDLTSAAYEVINSVAGSPLAVSCCNAEGRFLSDDGRYSVFDGNAAQVIAGQATSSGVFLRDHATGSVRSLSHLPGQPLSPALGFARSLSADGRFVYFDSAEDLVGAGSDPVPHSMDVFLFDRDGGASARISNAATAGATAGQVETEPGIAAAGGDLLFHSPEGGLIPGFDDANGEADPWLYLPATGALAPLAQAAFVPGQAPEAGSRALFAGAGGAYLLTTAATDLATGLDDANGEQDVFLGQRGSPLYRLVSSAAGQPAQTAAGASFSPVASADAAAVAFTTRAADATPATDANGAEDVVLWRSASPGGVLISHAAGDPAQSADGASRALAISDDGATLVFASGAGNLVPGFADRNGTREDLYLHRAGAHRLITQQGGAAPGQGGNGRPGAVRLAGDGSVVVFESESQDLVAGLADTNGSSDVFAFDTASGALSLLFHRQGEPAATPAGHTTLKDVQGPGGRFVLVQSTAADLVPGAPQSFVLDAYVLDRRLGRLFLISHPHGDPHAKAGGHAHAISADGRYVLFSSPGPTLFPGQMPSTGGRWAAQVVLHDRATGERLLVSHLPGEPLEGGGAGLASEAILSPDGSWVAFRTDQPGLAASDPGGIDLFLGRIDRGGQVFSDGFELGDSSLWSQTLGAR